MARSNAVSEDEMNQLSDAERAALEDDGAPGDTTPEGGAVIPDDDETPPVETPPVETPPAETPPAETPPEAVTGDEDEDEPFIPRYSAEPVADYAEQMSSINKKFEDGELTLVEYNAQRDDLIRQQTKAEIAAEQDAQLASQRWNWEVKRFIKDVSKGEGIDYNKPLLNAALDSAVKSLATAKDANGNLIHGDKDGDWFLVEAHKQIKEEFGLGSKVQPPLTTTTPPPNTRSNRPRDVPRTLASVPAADIPDTGAVDPFARIDKLRDQGHIEEYEIELAKMSKADQNRYLRG